MRHSAGPALYRGEVWLPQVFYAACQALLYILCYRLDHLMEARQPAHCCASNSPTGVLDSSLPGTDVHKQLRGLFTDVMPQLLTHRYGPGMPYGLECA